MHELNIACRSVGLMVILTTLSITGVWAEGEPAPLRLSMRLEKDVHALGDSIDMVITLHNESEASLRVKELVFDRQSLSFHVRMGQVEFNHLVIRPDVDQPAALKSVALPPGGSLSIEHSMPTVLLGECSIEPKFAGASVAVRSEAVTVRVEPPAEYAGQSIERIVVMETRKGTIQLRLFPEAAPNTCLSFLQLVDRGFYDGLTFHRVEKDPQPFVVQGGDPEGSGSGGPGYNIPAEFNEHPFEKGTLGMARSQQDDSAGSQFYICLSRTPHLDGKYTAFGSVFEGMDAVDRIEKGDQIVHMRSSLLTQE